MADLTTFVATPAAWSAPSLAAQAPTQAAALLRGSAAAARSQNGAGSRSSVSLVAAIGAGVAAYAVARSERRRTQRLAATSEGAADAAAAPCGVCGEGELAGRRSVATGLAGFLGASLAMPAATKAENGYGNAIEIDIKGCQACGGEGIQPCINCKGTGQFKMLSVKEGEAAAQYQYVDCPDCYGVGNRICERCLGTGLPGKQMRGFMRKPQFQKAVGMLRSGNVSIYNIKEYQEEVKRAMNGEEVQSDIKSAGTKRKSLS
eukprot:TRINITY_DN34149_c0_g1_i1.p1 TRINITY_DN34149_c0_g1~~TRINITY_DN34149_c0_g1_i1.p1  ORF type:complete len:282 (-),score=65.70 TRINITY_DN34149_c0_g1_i1:235-1017(-)